MKNFFRRTRKQITWPHLGYGLLLIIFLLVMVSPSAKSLMIQGMMKIGFFSPEPKASAAPRTVAPDVVFKNAAGEQVHITALKGKVVFVNFWATWCPPCRAEMPTIAELYEAFKDHKDVVFLIVDVDDSLGKAQDYLEENDLDLPLYIPAGHIPYLYFSGALPTTIMIDKAGKLTFRHAGAADYSDPKMMEFLKKLLAEDV